MLCGRSAAFAHRTRRFPFVAPRSHASRENALRPLRGFGLARVDFPAQGNLPCKRLVMGPEGRRAAAEHYHAERGKENRLAHRSAGYAPKRIRAHRRAAGGIMATWGEFIAEIQVHRVKPHGMVVAVEQVMDLWEERNRPPPGCGPVARRTRSRARRMCGGNRGVRCGVRGRIGRIGLRCQCALRGGQLAPGTRRT